MFRLLKNLLGLRGRWNLYEKHIIVLLPYLLWDEPRKPVPRKAGLALDRTDSGGESISPLSGRLLPPGLSNLGQGCVQDDNVVLLNLLSENTTRSLSR